VSRLRAKCPDCKTYTAVALGPEYECHSCGRGFGAGLVRVPQAWGDGGEAMAEAAWLELPYPETAVIEAETLEEQNLALAADLPERPIVLGGCCCSHIGAVEGLAARQDRVAVVWFDAHGDLNTVESSPSGNLWGMPLRRLIDSGAVEADDVVLIGARNLDPPEVEFIRDAERSASKLTQKLNGLWKTKDFNDALYHFDAGITTTIAARAELKVAYLYDYKNQPPPNVKKGDSALFAALLFKW